MPTWRCFTETENPREDDVSWPVAFVHLDAVLLERSDVLLPDLTSERIDQDDVADANDVELRESEKW